MKKSPYIGKMFTEPHSGFKGKCVCHSIYITGCDRLALQAPGLTDKHKPHEWEHFDINILKPEDKSVKLLEDDGGPRPDPPRR